MLASACLLAALTGLALAQTDIFVDDWYNRDQITYDPPAAWQAGGLYDRYAMSSTFANATGASATFKFTGIGIQYMGFADSSKPNTTDYLTATLDGEVIPIPGNLGLNHANQLILFERQGLTYGPHTIVIKKAAGPVAGADVNIDAFIYRIPDNSPTATKGGQPTGNPDSSSGASPGVIAGGVVGGVAAGGIIAFLVWFVLRRRRNAQQANVSPVDAPFDPYAPHPNAASHPDMGSIRTGYADPNTMPGYGSYSTVPTPYVVSGGMPSSQHSHSKQTFSNGGTGSPIMQMVALPQSPGSSSGQGSIHQLSLSSHGQPGFHDPGNAPAVPPLRHLPIPPPTPSVDGPHRIMSPQPPPPYAPS